ncbi:MAG: Holliday junction branch migration protein RuvA [bacterium]|nr:Holliday junction branch migration protein RuvA [bacterium]
MIGYLQGTLLKISPSRLLLDVGGVGYEVRIPLSTYYELERRPGDARVALNIHTHVREDAISLFGFWTERERQLFEMLIAISGIGPRLAQTVLSGMPPDDLIAALAAGDVRRLSSIPGIGKKTAERMLIELRDKVRDLAGELPEKRPPADSDLLLALIHLGYKQAAAERAVAQVMRKDPDLPFADLLRASLKLLSRA